MRQRMFWLMISLVALSVLVACASAARPSAAPAAAEESAPPAQQEPSAEEPAAGALQPVKVSLIMPSTINDIAWSQSIYVSLKALQDEVGADKLEFVYTENMFKVPDAAAAIRDYATNGYNLVIAHGAQYGDSLMEIAPDFPEVSFAWGTTTKTGKEDGINNVFAYEPRGDEAGYVTGVLAAKLTTAKIIGLVGPVDAGMPNYMSMVSWRVSKRPTMRSRSMSPSPARLATRHWLPKPPTLTLPPVTMC